MNMRKKTFVAVALVCALSVCGCIGGGKVDPSLFNDANLTDDPVIGDGGNVTDLPANNDNGDNTNNNTGDNGNDAATSNVLPSSMQYTYKSLDQSAEYIDIINAYDENDNILWTYESDPIGVGQYDNTTDIGVRDSGYYIVEKGTLNCTDIYTGKIKWSNSDGVGASCSYCFDDDDTIYICGYEGPALVVIDKDGNTLKYYGTLTRTDGTDELYWASGLFFDYDGKTLLKTFDNSSFRYVVDIDNGTIHQEEFEGEVNWNEITGDFTMTRWSCSDGRDNQSCEDKFEITITDDYYMTLKHININGSEDEFEYMPIIFHPGNLYDGQSDYYYGKWVGECKVWNDRYNSFAFTMTDPNTLEVIWFTYDDAGEPLDYYIISFFDSELLQYYKDVQDLRNNQNN